MISVVVGGQFGSEAKGHVAAQLARHHDSISGLDQVGVRVAGPNAGHTAYTEDGRKFAFRQIPVAGVVDFNMDLVIAAGSEIQPSVLFDEMGKMEAAEIPVYDRIYVDKHATVVEDEFLLQESPMHERLGSTAKGVGAARAARIMRTAKTWGDLYPDNAVDTMPMLDEALVENRHLILEGTQGYGLGLHAGFYPYCTSSDCRAIDFLAMAGVSPWRAPLRGLQVWVVLRTFPIRVAGNSGPLLDETTWEQLNKESDGHIEPEITTVTKKVRRVGRWDSTLAWEAVRANGGHPTVRIALTFIDYIDPSVYEAETVEELTPVCWDFIHKVEREATAKVGLVTTGPQTAVWL